MGITERLLSDVYILSKENKQLKHKLDECRNVIIEIANSNHRRVDIIKKAKAALEELDAD